MSIYLIYIYIYIYMYLLRASRRSSAARPLGAGGIVGAAWE